MDSCILPVGDKSHGLYLIQTTDFFTPLVDDPYLNGRISACNVLSDLYACGTPVCDNVLMLLGSSVKFSEKERDIVVPLMIQGFNDACLEADTLVRGGHTLVNPWPLIGGVASGVTKDFIPPVSAKNGDVLVLTKPLGTQIAVNMFQWRDLKNKRFFEPMSDSLKESTDLMYQDACISMATLNKTGAAAMQKCNAHAATDITGFGILGHAENLAKAQDNKKLQFVIDKLPILENAVEVDKECGGLFKLLQGFSAETSGGLLVAISEEDSQDFCDFVEEGTNIRPWIIGKVVENGEENRAIITSDVEVIVVNNLKYY